MIRMARNTTTAGNAGYAGIFTKVLDLLIFAWYVALLKICFTR
jgi:hypothetical protein